MFRRGRLQRSLITLLALLIVTPQVLLRPCCCASERPAAVQAAEQPEQTRALPPCCLKRLQASQKSAATKAAATHLADSRAGIHDSGRCGCRVSNQAARTNRTVFNATLARHSVVWTAESIDLFAVGQLTQSQVLTTAAHSAFPDWGLESCARLCRWIV